MTDFDSKSRERLVRVEVGINHITELVEKQGKILDCHLEDGKEVIKDLNSLKTTQKWLRWLSKTAIGAACIAFFGWVVM